MKQSDNLTAIRINSRDIRPFVGILIEAGEGEIILGGGSSVFPRDDVVYLKGELIELLRHATVLAEACRTPPYSLLKSVVHVD